MRIGHPPLHAPVGSPDRHAQFEAHFAHREIRVSHPQSPALLLGLLP